MPRTVSSPGPKSHGFYGRRGFQEAQGKNLNTFDLSGCDLYVNGPPCCMCFASIMWAGISRVFYRLSAKDAEDIGLGDQHVYEEMARSLEDRSSHSFQCTNSMRKRAKCIVFGPTSPIR